MENLTMTNKEFSWWLRGFFMLEKQPIILTQHQVNIINNHLNLVISIDGSLDENNLWLKNEIEKEIMDYPDLSESIFKRYLLL